ncbi:MAG: ABC transporter ATP-binding protein [Desulfatiglans sp.]|jgi:branched-chain amino acid transport system ATP-binding protein|nr:ABC transporter ATP-binding protein [Desulfatiglans sp.]
MSQVALLKVVKAVKNFGGVRAVHEVSLDLLSGEVLGIIGPNGSGKTTLVNLITGFIRSSSGEFFFKGKNITKAPPHKIAQMGLVRTFQMVRPFTHLPAFKNLIVPLFSSRVRRLEGGTHGDRDSVAIDLLEEVGFERDAYVPYKIAGTLPHGYIKRLELARCLALRPELIILDELFSGLSMAEVASMLPLLEKLRAEGITLIMVEHRLRELFKLANRVLVLSFGRMIAEGSPEEIVKNPKVKETYLGKISEV